VKFAETLNTLVQGIDIEGVCGWIVDLRRNSGGNLWPMLAGLGALLGEGELAASIYPDGRRVPIWHRGGQAGFGEYVQLRVRSPYGLRAAAPLAVLLGPGTASSGEVLAVAFEGRPATRSFGAPTRGLSAGNRTFSLSDGASLVLTVAATSDRDGRLRLGSLSPDVAVAASGAGSSGEDAVIGAATEWLIGGDSCR
jgi:C-terminal processing protease CtpA/Prc